MVRGIYLPAEAGRALEEHEFNTLEDYQSAVGGWIEAVDLHTLGVTIYMNEEGLLRHLPFNSRATFLRWYYVPESRQQAMLFGDAIIVGLADRNGDSTDVPRAVCELLLTPSRYYVEVRTAGDPTWHPNGTTYPDYWEAIVWAMVLLERTPEANEVRVAVQAGPSSRGSSDDWSSLIGPATAATAQLESFRLSIAVAAALFKHPFCQRFSTTNDDVIASAPSRACCHRSR